MPAFFFTNLLTQLPAALFLIATMSIGAGCFVMLHWDGALKEDGPDRERLLAYLADGGDWRVRYTAIILWALGWADRLLGDAGKQVRSFRWLTGDDYPWPCWSGWAFDRCALIAVVYPIAGLVLTWLATGEAGDIGAALGLPPHAEIWQRFLLLVAIGSYWVGATCRIGSLMLRFVVRLVVIGGVGALSLTAGGGAYGRTVVLMVCGIVFVLYKTGKIYEGNGFGWFWVVFWPLMTAFCYTGVWALIHYRITADKAVLLVMIALVPVLNIPFDFLAVGFTRGLLRRGIAPHGSTFLPFLLGLLDAGVGLVLQLLLAATLIIGLQGADAVMIRAGAEQPVIDVPNRLATLGYSPYSAENAWIYITLFSTLIPSALNLTAGAISLVTVSSDGHHQSLIRRIRSLGDGKGLGTTRFEIMLGLAAPAAFGTLLAGLVSWGLVLLLSLAGPFVLQQFLDFATWWEYRMARLTR